MGGEDREGEDGMGCSVLSVLFCLYIAEWTQAPVWALPEVLWVAVEPPFLLFLRQQSETCHAEKPSVVAAMIRPQTDQKIVVCNGT